MNERSNNRLFRVICEEEFITEAQRGCAAAKRIGICPAKTQRAPRGDGIKMVFLQEVTEITEMN